MELDPDTHAIRNVEVEPEYRGLGLARAMGEHFHSQGVTPIHSGTRTPKGDGFAKATPQWGDVPLDDPMPDYY